LNLLVVGLDGESGPGSLELPPQEAAVADPGSPSAPCMRPA